MKEKLGLIAIVLWAITAGVFGYFFVRGWTTESSDGRTAIHLAPGERDLVLHDNVAELYRIDLGALG